jgi:hypothetical protein
LGVVDGVLIKILDKMSHGKYLKIVLKKWIKDSKMEGMHTIEDEFNEAKEEISKL